MEEDINIFYKGANLFDGISHAPFIETSFSNIGQNRKIGTVQNYKLNGFIINEDCSETCDYTLPDNFLGNNCGECSFQEINYKKYLLLNNLSSHVGDFSIKKGNTFIKEHSLAKLKSVEFEDSNYASILPFTVEFDVYDSGCWKEQFGVSDSSDEVSYQDNNCNVDVNRTIFAVGFQTETGNNNSLQNAQNWVKERSGIAPCSPIFVENKYGGLILKNQKESIDRTAGSYRLDQSYIYSNKSGDYSNILYSTYDYQSGVEFSTVSINGSVQAGIDSGFPAMRNRVNNLDFYQLASDHFANYETGILNSGLNDFSIQEDLENSVISFQASYNNKTENDPYIIDNFNFNENLQDGKKCVNFTAEIKSDIGCREQRNQKILQYYSGFDFDTYIRDKWYEYQGDNNNIDPKPRTESFSYDEYNSSINVSFTYCKIDQVLPECLANLDYSIVIKPPLFKRNLTPSVTVSGVYILQNLNYETRGELNINGTARIDDCCNNNHGVSSLMQFIGLQRSTYISGTNQIITEQTIDWNDTSKDVSFSYTWSYNGNDIFSDTFRDNYVNQYVTEFDFVDTEENQPLDSIAGDNLIQIVEI